MVQIRQRSAAHASIQVTAAEMKAHNCVFLALAVATLNDDIVGHFAQSGSLLRQPYVQRVTATSAVVVWASLEAGPAEVRYQRQGSGKTLIVPAATQFYSPARTSMKVGYYHHEAVLTGLTSGTTYRYDVFVGGVDMTPVTDLLTTAPQTGRGTVSFAVFGDSGSGTDNQQAIADLLAAGFRDNRWDLAIHTGDIVYPRGTYQLFHDRFFAIYADWLRRRPIFFAAGNHEYYAENGQPYLDLFAMPENGHDPMAPGYRERYFSFDYGPIHFISLDTNSFSGNTPRQQQLTWLVRDLAATTQPWKVVFMHIPAYGSSDWASNATLRAVLPAVFERYGVQLVLAGHQHSYARGAPWRERPSSHSPITYVVSGGGGASLNEPSAGPWLASGARAYHFVSVTVTDCTVSGSCQLTLEAIDRHGQRLDAFTLPLRAQQKDAAPPQVAWTAPANGAVLSGTAQIAATAQDDQQVVKVDVWVDGALRLIDDAAPYQWSWDTTSELNGDHTLVLRAVDVAGRVIQSSPRTIRVLNPGVTVRLLSPFPTENLFTAMPFRIRWLAADGKQPITGFKIDVSSDGKTFQPLTGCVSLPRSARECLWNTPGPTSKNAAVRVTALTAAGAAATDVASGFSIRTGSPALRLSFPDAATTLGLQSTQSVFWLNDLGLSPVRLELSRDNGDSWEILAAEVLPLNGDWPWTVIGAMTTQGLIRVTSLNTTLQDVSRAPFKISPASVTLTEPKAGTVWHPGAGASVKWRGNLGAHDRFNVRLSTDGGVTFPIVLAGSVAARSVSTTFNVPAVSTDTARIKLESLSTPGWDVIGAIDFKIRQP
jgi:hypothetical protein